MPWPDGQLNPGQTPASQLKRRVKQHEFLMTGGIHIGIDDQHRAIYTPPIVDPGLYPECPFHNGPCTAWNEILEGRGTGEPISQTLLEIRNRTPEERMALRDERRARERAESEQPNKMAWYDDDQMARDAESSFGNQRRTRVKLEDSRDTAILELALGGEPIPDEITFEDGDEEDEGS